MAPHILLLGKIVHAGKEWEALSSVARLSTCDSEDRAQFIEDCKGKYADIVALYRTFDSSKQTGLFDPELVSQLPKSLKYVCHNGAGYDQIDVHACTDRGILVSNVPEIVDDATADVNMYLILGALRNFPVGEASLRETKWRGVPTVLGLGHDPEEKLLGIVGMGGIGREVRDRAKAFKMRVQYYNRSRLPADQEKDSKYVSLDELLRTSDVISLNLPLNKHTRHIINKEAFDKMKPGVVIVNTARGAVVNEADLVDALNSGKVANVGLDVFEDEPEVHPGLIDNPRTLLLPHLGTWTFETQYKMECHVINNIKSALTEGKLLTIVPEQK